MGLKNNTLDLEFYEIFDKQWNFWYEALFRKIFGVKNSLVKGYIALMFIWGIVTFFIGEYFDGTKLFRDWWLYYLTFCIFVGNSILFLDYAKNRTRSALPFILSIIPSSEEKLEALNEILLMGNFKKGLRLCIGFGIVGFAILLLQQKFNVGINLYAAFWTSLALAFTGGGLYMAITSIVMITKILQREIKFDFLNPGKTIGITKLASLLALYATLFAIQVSTWEVFYLRILLTAETNMPPGFITTHYAITYSNSFFIIFLPIIYIYFIYPQALIEAKVSLERKIILSDIQDKTKKAYSNSKLAHEHRKNLIDQYLNLFREVENHKGSLPTKDLLSFLTSFITTAILSVAGNVPAWINKFLESL